MDPDPLVRGKYLGEAWHLNQEMHGVHTLRGETPSCVEAEQHTVLVGRGMASKLGEVWHLNHEMQGIYTTERLDISTWRGRTLPVEARPASKPAVAAVLWIRNVFFRIRILFRILHEFFYNIKIIFL